MKKLYTVTIQFEANDDADARRKLETETCQSLGTADLELTYRITRLGSDDENEAFPLPIEGGLIIDDEIIL